MLDGLQLICTCYNFILDSSIGSYNRACSIILGCDLVIRGWPLSPLAATGNHQVPVYVNLINAICSSQLAFEILEFHKLKHLSIYDLFISSILLYLCSNSQKPQKSLYSKNTQKTKQQGKIQKTLFASSVYWQ